MDFIGKLFKLAYRRRARAILPLGELGEELREFFWQARRDADSQRARVPTGSAQLWESWG